MTTITTEVMLTGKLKLPLHHPLIFLPTVLDLISLSNYTLLFLTLALCLSLCCLDQQHSDQLAVFPFVWCVYFAGK